MFFRKSIIAFMFIQIGYYLNADFSQEHSEKCCNNWFTKLSEVNTSIVVKLDVLGNRLKSLQNKLLFIKIYYRNVSKEIEETSRFEDAIQLPNSDESAKLLNKINTLLQELEKIALPLIGTSITLMNVTTYEILAEEVREIWSLAEPADRKCQSLHDLGHQFKEFEIYANQNEKRWKRCMYPEFSCESKHSCQCTNKTCKDDVTENSYYIKKRLEAMEEDLRTINIVDSQLKDAEKMFQKINKIFMDQKVNDLPAEINDKLNNIRIQNDVRDVNWDLMKQQLTPDNDEIENLIKTTDKILRESRLYKKTWIDVSGSCQILNNFLNEVDDMHRILAKRLLELQNGTNATDNKQQDIEERYKKLLNKSENLHKNVVRLDFDNSQLAQKLNDYSANGVHRKLRELENRLKESNDLAEKYKILTDRINKSKYFKFDKYPIFGAQSDINIERLENKSKAFANCYRV